MTRSPATAPTGRRPRSPATAQPQHRGAVGQDQQDRHHRRRDRQQRDVGAGELRIRRCRPERRPPVIWAVRPSGRPSIALAQRLDSVAGAEARQPGVQRRHGQGGLCRRRTPPAGPPRSAAARLRRPPVLGRQVCRRRGSRPGWPGLSPPGSGPPTRPRRPTPGGRQRHGDCDAESLARPAHQRPRGQHGEQHPDPG